jgi:hypothetical protein
MSAVTFALAAVALAFASDTMREVKGYATAIAFAMLAVASLVIATKLSVGVMLP